jgi:hypothetical protein
MGGLSAGRNDGFLGILGIPVGWSILVSGFIFNDLLGSNVLFFPFAAARWWSCRKLS